MDFLVICVGGVGGEGASARKEVGMKRAFGL